MNLTLHKLNSLRSGLISFHTLVTVHCATADDICALSIGVFAHFIPVKLHQVNRCHPCKTLMTFCALDQKMFMFEGNEFVLERKGGLEQGRTEIQDSKASLM